MKKNLLLSFCVLIIGVVIGRWIFRQDFFLREESGDLYYFLVEGVYRDQDIFDNNMTDLKKKVMEYKDHKVYVYVGITRSLSNVERVCKLWEERGVFLSVSQKSFDNLEFKNNVEQFDVLVEDSLDDSEVLKIEEVVLANYSEIVKNEVSS